MTRLVEEGEEDGMHGPEAFAKAEQGEEASKETRRGVDLVMYAWGGESDS